jgi:hypothetical protein
LQPAAGASAAQQEAAAAGSGEPGNAAAADGDAEAGQPEAASAGAGAAGAPPAAVCAIIEKLLAFMEKHGVSFEVRAVLLSRPTALPCMCMYAVHMQQVDYKLAVVRTSYHRNLLICLKYC